MPIRAILSSKHLGKAVLCGTSLLSGLALAASTPETAPAIGVPPSRAESALPELDFSLQNELIVSSPETANWVLSYPAVLPLIPPADAAWAKEVGEAAGRGALAEAVFTLDSTPAEQRNVGWHIYRGNLLLRIGMLDEAMANLRAALMDKPDDPRALALASVIASAAGQAEVARELAGRATRLAPASGPAWLALSYTQQAQGDLDAALTSVRLAQSADPSNGAAWIREAELNLARGRLRLAKDAADRALILQPESSISHTMGALVALLSEDATTARTGFERAVALNPADANARFGLALAHIQRGSRTQARDELEIAVKLAPNNSLFLTYLGRVQLALGEDGQAEALFERARKLDPNNPIPWLFSGLKHLHENRPGSALDAIRESDLRNESRKIYRDRELLEADQARNQIDLSRALESLGFREPALDAARNALESGKPDSAAYRNLADIYALVGRGIQARRSLALQSLFDAPLGQLPMALDVVQGVGSATSVPNHNLPSGLEPRQTGLNEYSALFSPAGWRLALDGNVAGYDTLGGQIRLGGRTSSLGIGFAQLGQRSDGVDEKRLDNGAWQGVLQARLDPDMSAFLEYRRATSQRDEIFFPYDPTPSLSYPLEVDETVRVARLGLQWRLDDHASLKVLFSRQWRNQNYDYTSLGFSILGTGTADMPEIQYQRSHGGFALTLGASRFDENGKIAYSFLPANSYLPSDVVAPLIYGYGTWRPNADLTVTLGLSHVDFSQNGEMVTYDRSMPKFGLSWRPNPGSQLRFAALEAVALPKTGGAGLEPVEVAGFQQWMGDEIGTVYRRIGLKWDQAVTPSLSLTLEACRDRLLIPGILLGSTILDPQYERSAKAGLFWRLPDSWLAGWEGSLRLTVDRLDQDRPNLITDNNSLKRQVARHWTLGGQVSGPRGLGYNLALTRVDATQDFATSIPFEDEQGFWMVDLAMTWNFDRNRKHLSLGVRNATDQNIGHYQEADPLLPRFSPERLFYGRLHWRFE